MLNNDNNISLSNVILIIYTGLDHILWGFYSYFSLFLESEHKLQELCQQKTPILISKVTGVCCKSVCSITVVTHVKGKKTLRAYKFALGQIPNV